MKDIFDGFEASKYEDEAKKRWGDTSAYQHATQRTKRYTADDSKNHRAERAAIHGDAVAVMRAGKEPHDRHALDVAVIRRATYGNTNVSESPASVAISIARPMVVPNTKPCCTPTSMPRCVRTPAAPCPTMLVPL